MTDNGTYPEPSTGWDWTDPLNPQPTIYPVCGGCREAYLYQRCLSLKTGGYVWAWTKPAKVTHGCRHKEPVEMEGLPDDR